MFEVFKMHDDKQNHEQVVFPLVFLVLNFKLCFLICFCFVCFVFATLAL